jgi:hypothetical protein
VTGTGFTRNAGVVRSSLLVLAAATASLIAGCGSGTTTESTPKPPRDGVPMIEFHVTGGIAGVNQELSVNSSGAASVTTGYREGTSTQHFRLSRAQIASLADELKSAHVESLPTQADSGCADCFEYSIGLGPTPYRTDQVSVPRRVQPLIATLTKLVSEHTPGSGPSISGK